MRVPVVNEKDEIIGHKERDDKDKSDITRVTGVWVVNDAGEVLITQRVDTKVHNPGKWEPSAAGTVEEGESYMQNVIKEIKEELGISVREDDVITGKRYFVETSHRYFTHIFFVRRTVPIDALTLDPRELQAAQWISVPKLIEWMREKPQDFIASCGRYIDELEQFVAPKL